MTHFSATQMIETKHRNNNQQIYTKQKKQQKIEIGKA